MKIILLILTFLIFGGTTNLVAQTDSNCCQNSIQASVGINQLKEENLHPKVSVGAIYSLKYTRERTKINFSYFDISFQYSKAKTVFEKSSVSMNIQIEGNYGYLFKLIKKDKLSFYLGPNLSAHYRLSHYPNWDDSHLYWADDFSLGVVNKLNYSLGNKTALSFDLNLSLLSVFSRPEFDRDYKIDDVSFGGILKNMNSNFELGTLNKAFNLHFQTEYQIKLSKKITEAITYSFDYGRFLANEGKPFTNLQHNLGLKLYF